MEAIDVRTLSKEDRAKLAAQLRAENQSFPVEMKRLEVPEHRREAVAEIWRSRTFLCQVYAVTKGVERLSICRTEIDRFTGDWRDGISWEELQEVKRQVGRGDYDAIEIYPRDRDVVNVANMRHLWVVHSGVGLAWRKPEVEPASTEGGGA